MAGSYRDFCRRGGEYRDGTQKHCAGDRDPSAFDELSDCITRYAGNTEESHDSYKTADEGGEHTGRDYHGRISYEGDMDISRAAESLESF